MNDNGETTPSPEAAGEGRWLSYTEIARVRGIGRESAVKLAQRERWRRIRGNDGAARVLVPPEWLKPAREPSGEQPPERSPELSHVVTLLEGALTMLREQLDRERERADQAEKARDAVIARIDAADADRRAADARADTAIALIDGFRAERDSAAARADRLEQALAAERSRADGVRERLDQAEAAAREADAQRRAQGLLARLVAAWRGK